ncbi:Conserved DNA-binding protein YbaB [Actinopolyspora xinjiangensis]|uniref:Conserved DNA-binding protein YbaB n=1 Tax=Actinopolyspora xinjiangensis TaxID=405564 RepID=A0A1H0UU58_9ACTN|nr:YbaB/EbfC family nucleoid-associated protein [Actinopolyspora xinjiangensis]SDP69720.1 Conserved DNA-binding protein YbaB [Actinopolyspora xinjiangensis]
MDVSERIQRMMSDFEQQAAKAAEVKERMSELRGTARSEDGTVEVTVAPSGAVLDLRLESGAVRQSHTALQRSLLDTIRQATQDAAARMDETVQPLLGDRAEQFKQAFNSHGAQPVTPEPGGGTPESGAGTASTDSTNAARGSSGAGGGRPDWEDEDDDFSDGSFLR